MLIQRSVLAETICASVFLFSGAVLAGEPVAITSSLDMKLIRIPAGEFWMGSSEFDVESRGCEKPRHLVRIAHPFYMAAHEVTVAQFRKFVEDTNYRTDAEKEKSGGWGCTLRDGTRTFEPYTWRHPSLTRLERADEHPVVNISWNDAVAFCQWLSRKEQGNYRLPTEAEWEYACRAGTNSRFYTGQSKEGLAATANTADVAYVRQVESGLISPGDAPELFQETGDGWIPRNDGKFLDGYPFTSPVGEFAPNPWGLYDMLGNVSEWCADFYGEDYYRYSPKEDPAGPEIGRIDVLPDPRIHAPLTPKSGKWHVMRGGSYESLAPYCAHRSWNRADSHSGDWGVRVVRADR